MALYVSIVVLAELAALPGDYGESDGGAGHSGPPLLAIVWGTSIGLALAHWFAFELAAVGFGGGKVLRRDLELAGAQMAGAALVAIATTIPILFADDASRVSAAAFAPSLIIGFAGYGVARTAGWSVRTSVATGVIVLAAGVAVAVIKAVLAGH
jgi:hypothetical protein